ncbi:MAG: AmmeMemoRadiSam system radical SAM enzyme [Candidatus Omnitrophica bacterium]|nr:AmmeMemoRadiSam system radical SAM enzyme [Candidatus Omnitrophota bacterium]
MLCLGVGLSSSVADLIARSRAFASKGVPDHFHDAMYWKTIDAETVQCELCPRGCTLSEGQRGFCRVREPRSGKLYTAAYGAVCAAHVDPIEKKPLFHFLPGSTAFSIATAGCNFRCKSCQNWQISQVRPEDVKNTPMSPRQIVDAALRSGSQTIAYTYTDPAIFYEYMLDTAKEVKAAGLRNMCHSNGSLNPEAVEEISLYLDAANIDLKGFTQEYYSGFAAGYLDTVLETLERLKRNKVWLEVTTLVVPTMNDDTGTIRKMCEWFSEHLGVDVPLHFSRFWPQYKLANLYPTPVETLEKARETALSAGLRYVYIGNVPGHPAENTYCHACKAPVIRRSGYTILANEVRNGKCAFCGADIPGVWK